MNYCGVGDYWLSYFWVLAQDLPRNRKEVNNLSQHHFMQFLKS